MKDLRMFVDTMTEAELNEQKLLQIVSFIPGTSLTKGQPRYQLKSTDNKALVKKINT